MGKKALMVENLMNNRPRKCLWVELAILIDLIGCVNNVYAPITYCTFPYAFPHSF